MTQTHLGDLREGGLRVSGQEQLVRLFQIGHLHVDVEPGDGRLRTQAPLQLLQRTKRATPPLATEKQQIKSVFFRDSAMKEKEESHGNKEQIPTKSFGFQNQGRHI